MRSHVRGPELRYSNVDCSTFISGETLVDESPRDADGRPVCPFIFRTGRGSLTLILNGRPISQVAEHLQPLVGRVVIDRTALTGNFDAILTFARSSVPALPLRSRDVPSDAPSVFTTIQEQLGLRLESTRSSVELLVIDQVALPTPD
jgi:uncharacterized protein (TIGR03435 family)